MFLLWTLYSREWNARCVVEHYSESLLELVNESELEEVEVQPLPGSDAPTND
jgi:hypothetical protein